MTIIATEAKTYLVDKECDECKKAYYRSTGEILRDPKTGLMVDPVLFIHRCPNCGDVRYLKNNFPVICQVRKDAEIDLSTFEE